jgi:hypothetical protein
VRIESVVEDAVDFVLFYEQSRDACLRAAMVTVGEREAAEDRWRRCSPTSASFSALPDDQPGAMPNGAELSIGYYPTGTSFALIAAGGTLRCTAHPPARPAAATPPQPVGPS